MLVFEWNALRVGDHVIVHDDRAADLALHDGVVAIVQTFPHAANDIAIRLDDTGAMLHPRRHAVHDDRADVGPACWRCVASAAATGGPA